MAFEGDALISLKLPARSPAHMWPDRTGLLDFALANTLEEIHQVALGLDFEPTSGPWLFEGLGLDQPPESDWGRWDPGTSSPGWWRALSSEGVPMRQIRFHGLLDTDQVKPGILWLRALVNRQPLVFCPRGLEGPGFVITPELGIPWVDKAQALGLSKALTEVGWPGVFPSFDPSDAESFRQVFGGFFVPGRILLDPIMRLVLDVGSVVPGYSKIPSVTAASSHLHRSQMRESG